MSDDGKRNQSYDTRKYVCCMPWNGKRGPAYTRRFKPEFMGALHGHGDRFATLHEHMCRSDPGAIPVNPQNPNVPHPGTANSNLRAESELAYLARSKKLYSLIWTHVEDIDIRARLEQVAGDGLAAWAIVEAVGALPTTGLTMVNQDRDWTNLKLTDVGITEETIVRFLGHMNRVNNDRIVPYDEETRRIRLLSCITMPNMLKERAALELQSPSYLVPINGTLVPSLRATVDAFDELWRLLFARGEIKYVAPPRPPSSSGQSVVAMLCEEETDANEYEGEMDAGDEIAMSAGLGEDLCYNCYGAGHRKLGKDGRPVCPSARRERNIGQIITALQALQSRQGQGLANNSAAGYRARSTNTARYKFQNRQRYTPNRGRGRGRAGARGGRGYSATSEGEQEAFLVEVNEMGEAYAVADGEYIGTLNEPNGDPNTDDSNHIEQQAEAHAATAGDAHESDPIINFDSFALVATQMDDERLLMTTEEVVALYESAGEVTSNKDEAALSCTVAEPRAAEPLLEAITPMKAAPEKEQETVASDTPVVPKLGPKEQAIDEWGADPSDDHGDPRLMGRAKVDVICSPVRPCPELGDDDEPTLEEVVNEAFDSFTFLREDGSICYRRSPLIARLPNYVIYTEHSTAASGWDLISVTKKEGTITHA